MDQERLLGRMIILIVMSNIENIGKGRKLNLKLYDQNSNIMLMLSN